MGKLYYTDPLAAAYMARNFEVELQSRHTDEQMDEYDVPEAHRFFDWWQGSIVDGWQHDIEMIADAVKFIEEASSKIYIHPDSYHIFEPVCDDIGVDDGAHTCEYGRDGWLGDLLLREKGLYPNEPVKIIQRNNKPFFTPEFSIDSHLPKKSIDEFLKEKTDAN